MQTTPDAIVLTQRELQELLDAVEVQRKLLGAFISQAGTPSPGVQKQLVESQEVIDRFRTDLLLTVPAVKQWLDPERLRKALEAHEDAEVRYTHGSLEQRQKRAQRQRGAKPASSSDR